MRPPRGTMGNVVVVPPNKAAVISGVGGTKLLIGECGWAWWCCNCGLPVPPTDAEWRFATSRDGRGREAECRRRDAGEGRVLSAERRRHGKNFRGNLKLACQHFLGEKTKAVQESLTATMEGHQRQVLGTLTVEKSTRTARPSRTRSRRASWTT